MVDEDGKSNDEENHIKRRASPTDLMEGEIRDFEEDVTMKRGGSGLSKRPSFKKMRATGAEDISSPATSSATGSPSSVSAPSPAKSGRKRFGSGST